MGDTYQPEWRKSATHTLHAVLLLKGEIEERLQAQIGINLADNEALLHLVEATHPLKMTDIAERLVLSKGGTTKVVDRLEADGLVARLLDPADRRVTLVEITPEGREVSQRARGIVDGALEELWRRHLTDEEMGTILQAVDRVLHGNEGWL